MAQKNIQRQLLCPGCKCLPVHQRLYLCLGGHTICARCITTSGHSPKRTFTSSTSHPCYSFPTEIGSLSLSESNPFTIGNSKSMFFDTLEEVEKSGDGKGDHQIYSEVSHDAECPKQSHDQGQYLNTSCPSCDSPMTKIRNLVVENMTLVVANLESFRSLPMECRRPAPPPSSARPFNTSAMQDILKPRPISTNCQPTGSQRRYCFVPKLDLRKNCPSIGAGSSEPDEVSFPSQHQEKKQQISPSNEIHPTFIKKNYSPITCPLSQCSRLTASSGFVHHFSFEHSDVTLHELHPGERLCVTVVPSAVPVGMARVAVLYLLANNHNIAYNTLMPRRFSHFRNHLPVCLLLARMAGGGRYQEDALLIWLACLEDSPLGTTTRATVNAYQASAEAPRLAQQVPIESLRLPQDPCSVMERGNAVHIHPGLLRQLVHNKRTFEISILVQE